MIAERFTGILKNQIYKYMTWLQFPKNVYIGKLDDIANKYNNTYHITIKMKPVDVKSSTYMDYSKENNEKEPKFKIDDIVRIPKYKNIFAKVILKIGLMKFLWPKKLKIFCHRHMLLMILMVKKWLELWNFTQKLIAKNKWKGI